jgi:hypothetical protein
MGISIMAKTLSEDDGSLSGLNKSMEVVIALLLRGLSKDARSLPLKEQIAILDGLGVRPVSIARIVGKKANYVNKELVSIRKMAK